MRAILYPASRGSRWNSIPAGPAMTSDTLDTMSGEVTGSASELLNHVDTDPRPTRAEALRRLQAEHLDDRARAELRWIVGMCERELGDLKSAWRTMEHAVDEADRSDDRELSTRVRLSMSTIAGRQGDLDRALALAVESMNGASGAVHAAAVFQVGLVQYWRGELAEAVTLLDDACAVLRRCGDTNREVQARATLGVVLCQLGRLPAAREQTAVAIELAEQLGATVDVGLARGNLGYLAVLEGDLPGAIAHFEQAEHLLAGADAQTYLPQIDAAHAQALGEAALFADAVPLIERALDVLERHGNDIEIAGSLIKAAAILMAKGDVDASRRAAQDAARWFRKHGRDRWVAVAEFAALLASARRGGADLELARRLDRVADTLEINGWTSDATRARLHAAKVRGDADATDGVDPVPPTVRRAALRGRASDQILLAHIDALVAGERGDLAAVRRAISRGLRCAMSSQAALGSIETRAHAAVHGYALTELGARLAVRQNRPRELLMRIEATRVLGSRTPDLRPSDDPEMAGLLTELRTLNATIADPSSSDEQRYEAERARARVERDVRRRSRTVRGDVDANVRLRDELGSALALLGDRQLLAHAALDGRLLAVSVIGGRARLHDLGSLDDVSDQLDGIAFSLHRLNRSQGSEASRDAAAEMLYVMADELAELLLPPNVRDAMEPVVVVPTAVLHDVPWGLLPPLGGRPVAINPSVSAWARAERTRQERAASRTGPRSVGFMAGPGLDFAEFEVENLSKLYVDPEVFVGPAATSDACVDLLRRADTVHIACHGSFRTDNPMFSSLQLADGPVIVHDLERLSRLPETVILPACSVGTSKALQGGSLLGLASALTALGACNVVAPLTPINDAASVTVMDRLHHELVSGATPAAALATAALEHDLTDPTAGAFITLGA